MFIYLKEIGIGNFILKLNTTFKNQNSRLDKVA